MVLEYNIVVTNNFIEYLWQQIFKSVATISVNGIRREIAFEVGEKELWYKYFKIMAVDKNLYNDNTLENIQYFIRKHLEQVFRKDIIYLTKEMLGDKLYNKIELWHRKNKDCPPPLIDKFGVGQSYVVECVHEYGVLLHLLVN